MAKRRKGRSQFRRDLPKVIALFAAIALLIACAGLTGHFQGERQYYSVRAQLLQDCNLPESMVASVSDYRYFYDLLVYHDGYEWMMVDVEPGSWTTPDGWEVGEATLWDVVNTHGFGISSALHYQIFHMDIPDPAREWFFLEYTADGAPEFLLALYDGNERLFLYRGHTLVGDPQLRITGPES